jgi:hypothetical protein
VIAIGDAIEMSARHRGWRRYADSRPHHFTVNEGVEHRGNVFGLVAPSWEQAEVSAA